MCTSPVLIRNNSKLIPLDSDFRMEISVPCGHCVECMSAKFNEWCFRIYYHALQTFKLGGYVLLDCLTYSNSNLPWLDHVFGLSNQFHVKCFNRFDVTAFLHRLRSRLKKQYGIKEGFTYYYVGEFGTRFTKRPHYHILFFVTCGLPPAVFSRLIHDCWQLGRTDGVVNGYDRLLYNTFSKSNCDYNRLFAISDYLSKYLNKSLSQSKRAFNIAFRAVQWYYDKYEYGDLSYEMRIELNRIKSFLQPFHQQSCGFGLYALQCFDFDILVKTGRFSIPVHNKVFNLAIPLYFYRKMFFKCLYVNGSSCWIVRSDKKFDFKRFLIFRLQEKINNLNNDVETYLSNGNKFDIPFDVFGYDFLNYKLFLQGRVNVNSVKSCINNDLNRCSLDYPFGPFLFNYLHPRYHCGCITNLPLEFSLLDNFKSIKYDEFQKNYMQDSFAASLSGFLCDVSDLLARKKLDSSKGKKEYQDLKFALKQIYKHLFNSKKFSYV